jgi:hypothetical protein
MSGFLLQRLTKPPGLTNLRLVDTGNCEVTSQYQSSETNAFWTHPAEAQHWKCLRQGERTLVIEGQPDRYPRADEPVETWIA